MTQSKVVIVTGGSRGIGAETVRHFAKNGYNAVINYHSNTEAAESVKAEVLAMGRMCITVQADVADEVEVKRLFQEADKLGRLAVLINNAGVLEKQARIENISADRLLRVLNTNVVSCFLCTKEAIKRMSTKYGGTGGSIVNVSSGAAKTGSPNEYVDYAASKGAMDTFTRGAALEVSAEGIRINGVRPGLIYTEMHALGGEPNRVDRLKEKIPLGRGGEAVDVASAIYWLASDASSFTTGSFIDTTGGL